jgi:hypothetical protein
MPEFSMRMWPYSLLGVAAGLWLAVLVRAYRRSRMMPNCWHCGAGKVRTARILRVWDYIPLLSFLWPVRCAGCLRRYYTMHGIGPARQREESPWIRQSPWEVAPTSTALALWHVMFAPKGHRPVLRVRFQPGTLRITATILPPPRTAGASKTPSNLAGPVAP